MIYSFTRDIYRYSGLTVRALNLVIESHSPYRKSTKKGPFVYNTLHYGNGGHTGMNLCDASNGLKFCFDI